MFSLFILKLEKFTGRSCGMIHVEVWENLVTEFEINKVSTDFANTQIKSTSSETGFPY